MAKVEFSCPGCGVDLSYDVAPWIMREVSGPDVGRHYIWTQDPEPETHRPDHVCKPGTYGNRP